MPPTSSLLPQMTLTFRYSPQMSIVEPQDCNYMCYLWKDMVNSSQFSFSGIDQGRSGK